MDTPVRTVLREKGHTVHTVKPTDTVAHAVERMCREGIGSMVVVEASQVMGVLSEREVMMAIASSDRPLWGTSVRSIMRTDPATIGLDATVREAMSLMTDRRTRHLPVLEGERVVGLVSIGDLTRWVTRSLEAEVTLLQRYIGGPWA